MLRRLAVSSAAAAAPVLPVLQRVAVGASVTDVNISLVQALRREGGVGPDTAARVRAAPCWLASEPPWVEQEIDYALLEKELGGTVGDLRPGMSLEEEEMEECDSYSVHTHVRRHKRRRMKLAGAPAGVSAGALMELLEQQQRAGNALQLEMAGGSRVPLVELSRGTAGEVTVAGPEEECEGESEEESEEEDEEEAAPRPQPPKT